MDTKLITSFIAGIIGTAVMSFIMYFVPMMGIPEINPPEMLAGIVGMPVSVGWLMHFIVGITFAAFYVFLFAPKVSMQSKVLKGVTFGIIVFIFAQISMILMDSIRSGVPESEGTIIGVILGGIMGHMVFGIFVALSVKN